MKNASRLHISYQYSDFLMVVWGVGGEEWCMDGLARSYKSGSNGTGPCGMTTTGYMVRETSPMLVECQKLICQSQK